MKKYYVCIDVVYGDEVYAEDEDEAIRKVIESCPFDNDSSVEPYVREIEDDEGSESE